MNAVARDVSLNDILFEVNQMLQSELPLTTLPEQDNPISDAPVLYIDLSSYLS